MNHQEQTLSFECVLEQPPAQVWRALTDPVLLAQWLMSNDGAWSTTCGCSANPENTRSRVGNNRARCSEA